MVQRWFEAANEGGDPDLEYEDRHPACVIEIPRLLAQAFFFSQYA